MDDIATRALKLAETEGITPAAAVARLRQQEPQAPTPSKPPKELNDK